MLIRYSQRLGDIVRCLPAHRHFAGLGFECFHECKPCYHPIFDNVSYAKPVWPAEGSFDLIFNPEVWPDRYQDFRTSGKKWMDYVYGLFPEWAGINRAIIFDRIDAQPDPVTAYKLPPGYCILSPFGYSQAERRPLAAYFVAAAKVMPETKTVLFCDSNYERALIKAGFPADAIFAPPTPAPLPRILRDAAQVMTINSAPAHISAAVRKSYYHIPESDWQNDLDSPNQIRIPLP